VGEIAGMAFENIRLYEKMRLMYQHQKWRKGDEQRKLLELASVLATKLDVKDMLDTAVNMIKQFLRADFAWFLEVDSRGNLVLKSASDSGIPEGTVIYEKGSSCIEWAAIEGKKPVVVPDLASGSGVDLPGHLAGQNFKTACSVPVYSGAEAFAAISFYCSSFRQPKEEDIYFLQTVANIVDVALERARLYDRLMIGKGMSEAIIESMSDGIITTDTNGSVITMNNAALSMARLGQDPAGTHVAGLFSGSEENDRFGLLLAEGLKETMKGVRLRRETVITGAEGAVVPIVLNAYPARDKEGEVASAVFVLRDMSRHEEVDRLKSEFLRSVSHEFRTPLAAIVGMSEMILDGEVPEEKERIYLETILGEGRKLSGVVSDLLDLAAIEGGKEVLRMEEIDAGALLREIAGEFSPIAQKKGITVKVSTGGPLPVSGDPGRLKQLLRNLVENSLAYSDSGAVVDLLASREDGLCELTVRDTGWGIPEDDIKHLGEKFYRGKNAASTRGKGLGLSLVKEIVRVHCGALKIESCKGKGTTVRISLPARRPGEKDNNN
jgi:PAS domain S-box-containing protein